MCVLLLQYLFSIESIKQRSVNIAVTSGTLHFTYATKWLRKRVNAPPDIFYVI